MTEILGKVMDFPTQSHDYDYDYTKGDFQKSCYDFFPFVKVIVMTMTLVMTSQ